MNLTVHVQQHHIDAGIRGHCRLCPVAVALQHATGEAWNVDEADAWRGMGKERRQFRFPPEVVGFIGRFDDGEQCEPFSFTVEVPE